MKGTTFDFTGCKAEVEYNNDTKETINITAEMTTGGDINTVGTQIIKYTIDNFEIVSLPNKTTYIEKSRFYCQWT